MNAFSQGTSQRARQTQIKLKYSKTQVMLELGVNNGQAKSLLDK